ncbi:MAG: hypothetical protein IIX96_03470, partial [Clostridia bacterium]|nr:hypothetical protein [Clostridia bacterium]
IFNIRKSAFTKPVNTEYGDIFKKSAVASKNEYPDYILQATTGYVWNKMFKRSFVEEKGLAFPTELYVFEDVYFVVTALSMAERVGKVSETLVHHRVYSSQSRTRTFRKHYNQVPLVYTKIKEFLMHNGMYAPLSRSFLNLSASRCFSIYNLLWRDAKEDFWSILHNDYAEALGWHLRSEADFERRDVCEFVMNIVLYDHTTYLRRLVRGIKIRFKSFAKRVKLLKFKKSVSDFFKRIFKKKKTDIDA